MNFVAKLGRVAGVGRVQTDVPKETVDGAAEAMYERIIKFVERQFGPIEDDVLLVSAMKKIR